MFGLPGGTEWIVILFIALLIFGPRLPQVMRSLGKGVTEFKKGVRGLEDDIESEPSKAPEPEDEQSELKG
jgi:sec-independent protein translocase protein TatA